MKPSHEHYCLLILFIERRDLTSAHKVLPTRANIVQPNGAKFWKQSGSRKSNVPDLKNVADASSQNRLQTIFRAAAQARFVFAPPLLCEPS